MHADGLVSANASLGEETESLTSLLSWLSPNMGRRPSAHVRLSDGLGFPMVGFTYIRARSKNVPAPSASTDLVKSGKTPKLS